MRMLRNTKVGVRLGFSFGLLAVLLLMITGVGWNAIQTLDAAQEQILGNLEETHDILVLKAESADLHGEQTNYVFDASRGVANATDDNTGARKRILEGAAAFAKSYDTLTNDNLSAAVSSQLPQLQTDFDAFMKVDDQIIALLKKNTPAATAQAIDLNRNEEDVLDEKIKNQVEKLADGVAANAATDEVDASNAANRAKLIIILIGIISLALAVVLAIVITRSITTPLRRSVAVLRASAGGDLTARIEDTGHDEVGQMGAALNTMLGTLNGTMHEISGGSVTLSSSSEELSAISQQMSAAAEETAVQAGSVSAAAEQVSQSLQSVSAGAEELSTSIREIASNTSKAASVAGEAVVVAGDAEATVAKLGASSSDIGEVIKVITSIAQQTKMLALNASIEAARAGEAGKGFAVVANEVKDLARMTAQSSDEISRMIESIQSDSQQAVGAIEHITGIINQINDIQIVVAAAVEEQSVTTRDIGRSLTEAATGSASIARNITGVAETAQGTTRGAAETQRAAADLARLSSDLLALVGQFQLEDRRPAARPVYDPATAGTAGR